VFDACVELVAEFEAAQTRLSDPALHADQAQARQVARRHAELKPIVEAYREWVSLGDDVQAARELSLTDS
jgi:Protein chain release factor A